MPSELIINTAPWETRIALLENGSVVEFHVERKAERGYVGNIYKGRVVRVLPGMQAAFVEIGLNRTGFIYISDVYDHISEFEALLNKGCCEEETISRGEEKGWRGSV
jgi:ribonuclease G